MRIPGGRATVGASLLAALIESPRSLVAQSLQPSWYVGVSVGRADFKPHPTTIISGEADAWSRQFVAGYRFNRHFALEGGYLELSTPEYVRGWPPGSVGVCSINSISPCNGNVREAITTSAYMLAAVGTMPITERWAASGKLGGASVGVTSTMSQQVTVQRHDRQTRPIYGAGVRYAVFSRLAIRAEWEAVRRAHGASEADAHVYSAGIELRVSR